MRTMWDVFCSVVDNYGDVGFSWRLARALVREHGIPVRLWIDDMQAFAVLDHDADTTAAVQMREGVEVRAWTVPFAEVEPAEVVIEAFGCALPETYLAAMARKTPAPVWINLEYLSAEDWVNGCHGLPSPHPRLPLRKHFFFPGFDELTGGLLRERGLIEVREAFQSDPQALTAFWENRGVPAKRPDELRVSLFCYENAALPGLLDAWSRGSQSLTCLVPEGRAGVQIARLFGAVEAQPGDRFERGVLAVQILPFTEQPDYDRLLWACDLNFVRGEDSFVRAQWAARPLVWHIYPQAEHVHHIKLAAFLDRYCSVPGERVEAAAAATRALHGAWNGMPGAPDVAEAWNQWRAHVREAQIHAWTWTKMCERGPELAAALVKFAQGQVKYAAF